MLRTTAPMWMVLIAGCATPGAALYGPGEVTEIGSVPCPAFLGDEAECARVQISCDGMEDLVASVAVTESRATTTKGTVVTHSGGDGTKALDAGFVSELADRNFRVVQLFWDESWQVIDASSIKAAACRPATALAWIHEEYHLADRETGYCAIGHSAGSAAMSYSLAHYGAGELLDHALLSAGPVFSRVDAACDPVAAGFGELTERAPHCAGFPTVPFVYSDFHAENVVRWSGEATCGEPYGDLDDVDGLREQSILSDGAVLSYPQTRLDTWWCNDDLGGAAGQGTFFADEVESELERHCASDCIGEASWSNPAEFDAMADTIARECVPRH